MEGVRIHHGARPQLLGVDGVIAALHGALLQRVGFMVIEAVVGPVQAGKHVGLVPHDGLPIGKIPDGEGAVALKFLQRALGSEVILPQPDQVGVGHLGMALPAFSAAVSVLNQPEK